MPRCEDYPCCGHGPPPLGDDGGCPDEDGRFDCVLCGRKLALNASSSICAQGHGCRVGRRGRTYLWGNDADEFGDDLDR